MQIISQLKDQHIEQLWRLFKQEWWTNGRSIQETQAVVVGSQTCAGLVNADKLIRFTQVLTDYTIKAFVFDIIVDKAHRGQSSGKKLMGLGLNHEALRNVKHFELYCLLEMVPFYKKFEFSTDFGGIYLMRKVQ